MRGVTYRSTVTALQSCNISIHTPHAGSDANVGQEIIIDTISIHTPHAGSDVGTYHYISGAGAFQSTLPMRGVTDRKKALGSRYDISIHTPHAGSDIYCKRKVV